MSNALEPAFAAITMSAQSRARILERQEIAGP
jgi:hypothetical protein